MKPSFLMDNPPEPTVLAYAAGLFDGEGHIAIACPKASHNGKRYHRLQLHLTNCDLRSADWLKEHFGGVIVYRFFNGGRSRRPVSRWQMNGIHAEEFLRLVRPYMVLKADQADIALLFRATRVKAGGAFGAPRGTPANRVEDVQDYREELRQELNRLKHVVAVLPEKQAG